MDRNRFVPRVDEMEVRLNPAFTTSQVAFAAAYTADVDNVIAHLYPHLGDARTSDQITSLATLLNGMAEAERDQADVLGQFSGQLQAGVAADPAHAGTYQAMANEILAVQNRALLLMQTSNTFSVGFGGAALSPPAAATTSTSNGPGSTTTSPPPASPPPPAVPEPPTNSVGLSETVPTVEGSNVTTQPDGLKIQDVTVGTGPAVQAGDKVTVYYTGWLASNGTQFDSNVTTGPTQFSLTGVIKGWQEGVPGMQVGGIRRLYVPAALGYGASGAGSSIPPNSDLIFEIKLVSDP